MGLGHRTKLRAYRLLVRLASFLATLVPVFFLAFLCVDYLNECLQEGLKPGNALVYEYATPAGNATLRIESFRWQARPLRINAERISLVDGRGSKPLAVKHADIALDGKRLKIEARGVDATVTRVAKDRFDVQDLAPTGEGPKSDFAVSLVANQITIHYKDLVTQEEREFRSNGLRGEFWQDEWLFDGTLREASLGELSIKAQGTSGTQDFMFNLPGANLSGWILFGKSWLPDNVAPELLSAKATSLLAGAKGRLTLLEGRPPIFRVEWSAEGSGIAVGNYAQNAKVTASGIWTEAGGTFQGFASDGGLQTVLDGNLRASTDMQLALNFDAKVTNKRSLAPWLRGILPKELDMARARIRGSATVRGDQFAISGPIEAERAAWSGEWLSRPRGRLYADSNTIRIRLDQFSYQDSAGKGFLALNTRTQQLRGALDAQSLDLAQWGKRFGVAGVSGTGKLTAIISGSTSSPVVVAQSEGSARWTKHGDGQATPLGGYEARVELRGNRLLVKRAVVTGSTGMAVVDGFADLGSKELNLSFRAGGIELGQFVDDIEGVVFGSGTITGSFEEPKAQGELKVFGLTWQEQVVPVLQTDWTFVKDADVVIENLRAAIGSAEAGGRLVWNPASGKIEGKLAVDQLEISDFTNGSALGRVKLGNITIGGTTEDPSVSAQASAEQVFVEGIPLSAVTGNVSFSGGHLHIADLTASIAGGTVRVTAGYEIDSREGSGKLMLTNVPIEKLPLQDLPVDLSGRASGTVDLSIRDQSLHNLGAELNLGDLAVNRALVGSGKANVKFSDEVWTGSAEVGQLTGFVVVEDARYVPATNELSMVLESLNVPLETYTAALSAGLESLDLLWQERILAAQGSVTGRAALSGLASNPTVEGANLRVGGLVFAGRTAGSLTVEGSSMDSNYNVSAFEWRDGNTRVSAKGNYSQDGVLNVEGSVSNFDMTWLNTLAPEMVKVAGLAEGAVRISGKTDDLRATGSFGTQDLRILTGDQGSVPLAVLVEQFDVANGEVTATGAFAIDDFAGRLEARAPLAAIGRMPEDRPEGESNPWLLLTMNPRELRDVGRDLSAIDFERSDGRLAGQVRIEWQPEGAYLDGQVQFSGEQLYFKDLEQGFLKPNLKLNLKGQKMDLFATADGSAGGKLSASVQAQAPSSFRFNQPLDDLLSQLQLQGGIVGHNLKLYYTEPKSKARSDVLTDLDARIGGNALAPVLSGIIRTAGGDITLPSEFQQTGTRPAWLVDPIFNDFRVETAPGTTLAIRAGEAKLAILGGVTAKGSLSAPNIAGEFEVDQGFIKLPTARVTFEPGGRLAVLYEAQPDGTSNARVDVNLVGQTNLTARSIGDQIERYDITLEIEGNLVAENGLRMRGTSDPPDLNSDEILALLGQKSLLEALNPTRFQGDAFRELFYGYAIPNLTDPITRNLAQALGLDYLSVEYNQFEQASINLARTLGPGLVLSARRQLSPPRVGERQRYEVKLTYRPKVRNRLLNRLRFSVGLDQDRPWKIGIDYTIRF